MERIVQNLALVHQMLSVILSVVLVSVVLAGRERNVTLILMNAVKDSVTVMQANTSAVPTLEATLLANVSQVMLGLKKVMTA